MKETYEYIYTVELIGFIYKLFHFAVGWYFHYALKSCLIIELKFSYFVGSIKCFQKVWIATLGTSLNG